MRSSRYLVLAALALMLPVSVFARSKNQRNVQLASPAMVGSTQLAPGAYKIEWQGSGPIVNLEFIKNNKTVATTHARWVTEPSAAPDDSVVLKKTGSNQNRLIEIDFHNQKQALQIAPAQGSSNRHGT